MWLMLGSVILSVTVSLFLTWIGAPFLVAPKFMALVLWAAAIVSSATTYTFCSWLQRLEARSKDVGAAGGTVDDPNTLSKVALPTIFSPHERDLTIVFPAYNESPRLPATLTDTLIYLEHRKKVERGFSYEVLVVDDGSSDGTAAVGYDFSRRYGVDTVRVVRQPTNQGKGAAVRKGMLCARGALLLFADADAATRIADVEKLEEETWKIVAAIQRANPSASASAARAAAAASAAAAGSAGVATDGQQGGGGRELILRQLQAAAEDIPVAVFGSRAHLERQALATRKWYRNILMHGFHLAVLLAAGPGIRDTQCGFKLFTRAAARCLFANQRLRRWCFDVELLYLAKRLHVRMAEVAVTWTEVPGSKLRPTSILHMLLELAAIRIGYGLGFWPIRPSYTQT